MTEQTASIGTTTLAAEPLPQAEPGGSTSEYQLTTLGGGVIGLAEAALAVAKAFGAAVTSDEVIAVQGFVGAVVALVAAYAISRGIRKSGTQG